MATENKYEEPPLYEAVIDKALQKPAMFLYVPVIKVFLPEVLIGMFLFALLKFWVIVLLPIHLVFVIKTNINIYWVDDFFTNFFEITLASNKGIKGKKVLTFIPKSEINHKIKKGLS